MVSYSFIFAKSISKMLPKKVFLNYKEEWREQAQRNSGNLQVWKGANTCPKKWDL